MFGLVRAVLALMVMICHLLVPVVQLGTYAVLGFYVISGYLMTAVMLRTYGGRPSGVLKFIINRMLRLYPQYWATLLLTLACIWLLGAEYVSSYHRSMVLPGDEGSWLANLTMIYPTSLPRYFEPRLSPSTWAITIELFYYGVIALGASKSMLRVSCWIGVSLLLLGYTLVEQMPWQVRYLHIVAGSLPFALGAFVYHIRQRLQLSEGLANKGLVASLCFCVLNLLVWSSLDRVLDRPDWVEIGLFVNVLAFTFFVYCASCGGRLPCVSKRADAFLGDYSYPIYLTHWVCGMMASYLIFGEVKRGASFAGGVAFILALALTMALSALLVNIIDRPVSLLREMVRPDNKFKGGT